MRADYTAAIFDFDGLLIDTEGPWYDIFRALYARYDQELTTEMWSVFVGTHDPEHDWYTLLAPHLPKEVSREMLSREADLLHKERMAIATLRPGVLAYLQAAHARGMKVALASSSTAAWVQPFLARHALGKCFSVVCTADDVRRVKPDTELYLLACHRLGVAPQSAIAFEDSPNGARAAKAAGLTCVIVPNELTATYAFDAHDLRLSSMAELAFEELLDKLQI